MNPSPLRGISLIRNVISHNMKDLFIAYSDERLLLPILTTSLIHFPLEGWENVLLEHLGVWAGGKEPKFWFSPAEEALMFFRCIDHSGIATGVKFGQHAAFLASTGVDRHLKFYAWEAKQDTDEWLWKSSHVQVQIERCSNSHVCIFTRQGFR